MRRAPKTILRSTLAILACFAVSAPVAASNFDARSIEGTYTLTVDGFTAWANLLGLPGGVPLFAVATVTFDGRGGCESRDKVVVQGMTLPDPPGRSVATAALTLRQASDCTYRVNPDGFGTFSVVFDQPVPTTTTTTFVITDRDEIEFIANNPELGIYGGGELKRRRR